MRNNPLLRDWTVTEPYGLPPFSEIEASHFAPAFDVSMSSMLHELKEIAENPESPTFENTIAAFDRAGGILDRTGKVFSNLCSSNCPAALQAVQLLLAPILAAHESKVFTFPGLFPKISTVHDACLTPESPLNPEQKRLVQRVYLDFVRAGAKFDAEAQKKYADIMERLSTLTTQFQQNVMADESEITLDLALEDMAGCPEFLIGSAKVSAAEMGKSADVYVITLSRSLVEPFLTFSPRRDLRERAWRLWTRRGQLDPQRANLDLAKQILLLRTEQAALHGYATFADYQTADTMAGQPRKVMDLLEKVWVKACASADRERGELESFLRKDIQDPTAVVESWDWRYCAENVRKEKYDFDEALLKPYLSLPVLQNALFSVCKRLYGLNFVRMEGVKAYHPDVEVWEVRELDPTKSDGSERLVAVFLHDNFARPNKHSGAWMSSLCDQSRNSNVYTFASVGSPDSKYAEVDDKSVESFVHVTSTASSKRVVPIVLNNNNFARGAAATPENPNPAPCLLSFDDAITLFHELGHGLHGMLSDVQYSRMSGTNVLIDFVELPSQLMEHWLRSTDAVLKEHAMHYETKEPIPLEMLDKLTAARNFNQGFATVEYTICALLDQAMHTLPREQVQNLDIQAFEEQELARLSMPRGITMRHRPAHFQHLFASSSYAAAYYVYLWAEVLDADAFGSFLESGDVYNPEVASKLRKYIYSSGNSMEPSAAYRAFKGRDPTVEPMLRKKGLLV